MTISFHPGCKVFSFAAALLSVQAALAIQHDLVTNGSAIVPGTAGNAILEKSSVQPTGSGVLNPFLRIHDNDNFEQGFNTSAAGNPPDGFDAINGVHTHDLLLSSLTTVNRGGADYFQFILDIGEPGNSSSANARLVLQTFNLYTGNNDAPTFAEIGGNPDNLGTSRFKFNFGETVMLLDENSGNGQADVLISVPFSAFNGVTDTYLYLFSELGINAGGNPTGAAGGSFEEYAALTGPRNNVPEGGSTFVLLGTAMAIGELLRRFLNRRAITA